MENLNDSRYKLKNDFLETFPIETLRVLSLEQYTDLKRENSFCYWLESRTYDLGSIWGGSSYKFGIYRHAKVPTDSRVVSDDEYTWYKSFNAGTRDEAFSIVRNAIVYIAEAADAGKFERIEEYKSVFGDAMKWKIAFLYSHNTLVPIYKKEMLVSAAVKLGFANASKASTVELQTYLMSQIGDRDLFTYYDYLLSILKDDGVHQQDDGQVHYWTYSPGENASMWTQFYSEGLMGLGWAELGDLKDYSSQSEIKDKMDEEWGSDSSHKNDVNANWEFANSMKIGDVIFVKKGRRTLVGRGIVESEYYYDNSQEEYRSRRKVNWTHNGEWTADDMAMKTLTDITAYPDFVKKLEARFDGINAPTGQQDGTRYWFLNAKPKVWSMNDWSVGEEQDYTLLNENGNKRRVYQNFLDAKVGDKIICYESTPTKKIVGLAVISKASDGERVYFKKTETLLNPIEYSVFKEEKDLEKMEFLVSPNGSLFKLTELEYNTLMDLIRESNPVTKDVKADMYTDSDFLREVYMSDDSLQSMKELLVRKKNIILQGAPGVGKTFCAKRLCYAMMGKKDDSRIAFIQFHQNYSYEDFIMGYKPSGDSFGLKPGIFYNFCKRAQNTPDKDFFFIIDEINRGNLSKIFGELLMLIENDYRSETVTLAYNGESFSVPSNVYLIGMMNTADRSLAMIDYALRRRFSFVEVSPCYTDNGFKQYVKDIDSPTLNSVIEVICRLNEVIRNDDSLGRGFEIGHSYFCNLTKQSCTDSLLKGIVKYDIIPTLQEYWFDDSKKVEDWSKTLLALF